MTALYILMYILTGCWISGIALTNAMRSGAFHFNNTIWYYLVGWTLWPLIPPAYLMFIISQRKFKQLYQEDMKHQKPAKYRLGNR